MIIAWNIYEQTSVWRHAAKSSISVTEVRIESVPRYDLDWNSVHRKLCKKSSHNLSFMMQTHAWDAGLSLHALFSISYDIDRCTNVCSNPPALVPWWGGGKGTFFFCRLVERRQSMLGRSSPWELVGWSYHLCLSSGRPSRDWPAWCSQGNQWDMKPCFGQASHIPPSSKSSRSVQKSVQTWPGRHVWCDLMSCEPKWQNS